MSPLMGELCETVERLPEDKQAHVLDFALFLAQREEAPPPSPVVEETKREEAPVKDQPVIEPPSVEEIEALLKRLSYPVRERLVKIAMGFEELDLEQVRRVLAEFHQESEELVETQAENLGSGNE